MRLIIREARMLLAASRSATLLDLSKRLEGRRKWAKNGLTLETTGHNIEVLREGIQGLEILDKRTKEMASVPLVGIDFEFKTKPYPHQNLALDRLSNKINFALFMEPGTGKSKVILDWAYILHNFGKINGLLVIAPKGVHVQWVEDQATQHMTGDWYGSWWPSEIPDPGAFLIYTMNYDALRSKKGMARAKEFIHRCGGRVMLALDESQNIKNPNSQRWHNCKELRDRVTHCVLATGTPIAKDLCDEWAQLKLLDEDILGIRYITHFRNEYCIMGGYQGRNVVGTRNLELFKSRTAPYVYRVRKHDLGIEPKQYSVWKFDMTPKQRNLYRKTAREALLEIEDGQIKTIEHAVVRILHLQQISNGFISYKDEEDLTKKSPAALTMNLFKGPKDNPRIQALLECLENLEEEQVIVWCRFHYDVEQVCKALEESDITYEPYYGPIPQAVRYANMKSWLAGERRVFVATPGTGGTGLNLQGRCTHAIYYSNSENSIQRWQSEDRIHRIGIKQPISYIDLVARASRDLPILANLRRKKNLSDLTLDDFKQELKKLI